MHGQAPAQLDKGRAAKLQLRKVDVVPVSEHPADPYHKDLTGWCSKGKSPRDGALPIDTCSRLDYSAASERAPARDVTDCGRMF